MVNPNNLFSDIITLYFFVSGDLVDWNSIDGNTLAKLLIPSTNQINFSIGNYDNIVIIIIYNINLAHELAHIQHLDFLTRSTLAPLALITLYHTACILPHCMLNVIIIPILLYFVS